MADAELLSKLTRRQQAIDNFSETTAETEDVNNGGNFEETEESTNLAISEDASDELKQVLNNRTDESCAKPFKEPPFRGYYAEFPEFTRKQIKQYETMFKRFDENKDNMICFEELKRAMEKLGEPQTHLSLKEMIKEIDDDKDGKISFREFLNLFRKAHSGELAQNSALSIFATATEIDVTKEGLGKAKEFFEEKVKQLSLSNAMEMEIKNEQQEKKRLAEEKRQRREEFASKLKAFS